MQVISKRVRDARRAARSGVALAGHIRGRDHRTSYPCRVLDLSATGARVELEQSGYRVRRAQDLPNDIILMLPIDRVEVSATIVWHDQATFGVRFTSFFRSVRARQV